MSHWAAGKLSLKCSIKVLEKALINIMPEWKDYIKVDPNAGLTIRDMSNKESSGFNIAIPKNAPGMRWCDLGFKRSGDGTWSITIDKAGVPYKLGSNPDGKIKQEVGRMKSIAQAISNGFEYTQGMSGDSVEIDIIVPVGEQYKITA